MNVASGVEAKGPGLSMRRKGEPVGFALAGFGVQVLPLAFWSLPILGDNPNPYFFLISLGIGIIMMASLTCLAFAAGWRRSRIDLPATLAGVMLGLTYNYLPMLLRPNV
jgi:hypothetical protein